MSLKSDTSMTFCPPSLTEDEIRVEIQDLDAVVR